MEEKKCNNKKVLVVEDEKSLARIIEKQLEKFGCGVSVADNVEDAMREIEKGNIDAIWLDHYLLGKKNGLDLVVELKEKGGKFSQIPIFVVSNTATGDKIDAYLRLGVDRYYVKAEHSLAEMIGDVEGFLASNK